MKADPKNCPDCHGEGLTFDLRCDNCGGSASLPLEMRCENHLAKPQPCHHPQLQSTDWCDGCGRDTTVTDVWINRTPMTLCQRCVLDALTAEGERLGQYWGDRR